MMNQNLIERGLFAFYLTTEHQKVESEMTFGYYDKSKFTGPINWHNATYHLMFGIKLDDIAINGKRLNICGENGPIKSCLLTVDSGTSFLSMPSKAMNLVRGKIPTATEGLDCTSPRDFGAITWIIDGVHYTLEAEEWIYPPSDIDWLSPDKFAQTRVLPRADLIQTEKNLVLLGQSTQSASPWQSLALSWRQAWSALSQKVKSSLSQVSESLKLSPRHGSRPKKCLGTMVEMDLDHDLFLVGDLFMRKYYSIFDRDHDRIGLAKSVLF